MDPKDLIGLATGNPEFVSIWAEACLEAQRRQESWINTLRLMGVAAAHPDDGWVNQVKCTLRFCYPQFNDGAGIGSVVALGDPKGFRLVRLVDLSGEKLPPDPFSTLWDYVEINEGA